MTESGVQSVQTQGVGFAPILRAYFDYGLGNLELLPTQNCTKEFEIKSRLCHNDTTSASVYGECNNNKTGESIKLGFEQALYRAGCYPLVTNQPAEQLSLEQAMMAHKSQFKCEHLNRRAKSGYRLEPIYLHTPERIEAFLFLFKIALQMVVLIERAGRNNIAERDRGLDNFMPNRRDVRNPRT